MLIVKRLTIAVLFCGSCLIASADHSGTLKSAYLSLYKADYKKAIEQFQSIINKNEHQDTVFAAYEGLIECHTKTADYEKAVTILQNTRTVAISDTKKARLYILEGYILFGKGQYQQCIEINKSAIKILIGDHRNRAVLAEAYQSMAKALLWLSEPNKADSCVQLAMQQLAPDPGVYPIVYGKVININGIIDYFNGDFDLAIEDFEAAIEQKLKVYDKDHPEIGALYGNIGVMYNNLMQYDKALEYFNQDLEYTLQRLGDKHPEAAITYTNIGIAYKKMGRFDKASESHVKALAIRKSLGESHPKTLDTYEHLAEVSMELEDFATAENYLNKVLQGRMENYGRYNSHVTFIYVNLGDLFQKQGDYLKAQTNYEEALEIGEKVYQKHDHNKCDIYNALARNADLMGRTDSAKFFYVRAIESNIPGISLVIDRPEAADFYDYLGFSQMLVSINGMATVFNTDSVTDLQIAANYVAIGQRLITDFHHNFSNEKDRVTIASANKRLNELGLLANYGLYKITNDVKYARVGFEHSENSMALSLMTALSESQARRKSGIPDSVFAVDRKYRMDNDQLRSRLLELDPGQDEEEYKSVKNKLFNQKKEQERFLVDLADRYPKYAELKFGAKPKSINELQDLLVEDEALIEFFLPKEGHIYAFIITADSLDLLSWSVENIDQNIADFRSSIETINQEGYESNAQSLYRQIAQPIVSRLPNKINKLKIVPDGLLSYVPFELLIDQEGMLFEKFVISYAVSLSKHFDVKKDIPEETKTLAFAPVFSEDTLLVKSDLALREYGSIPGSLEEVNRIVDIMHAYYFVGDQATETLFKDHAKGYDILHLATHGVVEPEFPDYTKLVLRGDSLNDGLLHAYELQNLELNARLAVVSACNSGNGTYAEGEGVMSLSRAFAYAGVPATVVSLWPASDKSTPDLMKYFYENLKDGQAKDVALNNARKQYLATATGKARHPFYWGGFVLIGDNSPIETGPSNVAIILSLLFLITMVPIVLVIKKRYLNLED